MLSIFLALFRELLGAKRHRTSQTTYDKGKSPPFQVRKAVHTRSRMTSEEMPFHNLTAAISAEARFGNEPGFYTSVSTS